MARKDWLDEALAEMKKAGKPGVAIVVPDDDRMLAHFSDQLERLFGDGDDSAVFVCLKASHAVERFGEKSGKAALLLFDREGGVKETVEGDLSEVLLPAPFRKAIQKHVGKAAPSADRLPYGVKWDEEQHHKLFGTSYDPCPPCGMPRFDGKSSDLVRYLKLLDR
jgi:hypothetical protein